MSYRSSIVNLKREVRIPRKLLSLATSLEIGQKIARYLLRSLRGDIEIGTDEVIDPGKSIAFMPTTESCGLYINKRNLRDKRCYDEVIGDLITELSNLTSPFDGKKVFDYVQRGREQYNGEKAKLAPDIVFLWGKSCSVRCDVRLDRTFLRYSNNHHRLKGIFIAYGENIRRSSSRPNFSILDIAPTILAAMGIYVPKDVDGRVLVEIFEDLPELPRVGATLESFEEGRRCLCVAKGGTQRF